MKTFNLKATKRQSLGKTSSKALRNGDIIPAVLYGKANEAVLVHFEVEREAVRKLIYTPEIFVVSMDIDGQEYKAILKDVQVHPVTDRIIHLDFLYVTEDKPIVMDVPVVLDGLAEGVRAGGKLSLDLRKLKVKALYKDIPEQLHVNVENLALGKSIQVGQLHFEGLQLLNAANNVICRVQLTRAARGMAAKGN